MMKGTHAWVAVLIICLTCFTTIAASESGQLTNTSDPFANLSGITSGPTVNTSGTVMDTDTIQIVDSLGTTVTIHGTPQRIVSLAPSNTELLGSLDLMDRVVGVTMFCNYPEEALKKPSVGGFSTVNVEKVVAARPNLILAEPKNGQQTIDRLRKLGFPVIVLKSQDINEILNNIRIIGAATRTSDRANHVVIGLQQRLDMIANGTKCSGTSPTVAHIMSQNPIYVSGNNTYQNDIIRLAGGRNAFPSVEMWGTVTLEDLLLIDPDYILVNAGTGMVNETTGTNPVYEYFIHDKRTQHLKAVRENHFILVETNTLSRGGTRTIDATELIAHAIHPECFGKNTTALPQTTPPVQSPGYAAGIACAGLMLGVSLLRWCTYANNGEPQNGHPSLDMNQSYCLTSERSFL
jgi:iron complex transport system substrate-binding protein